MSLPIQTDSQRIGVKGEAVVEEKLSEIAVVNRLNRDFGMDFLCNLLDGDKVTSQSFFVQVKTRSNSEQRQNFFKVRTSTLNLWCSSVFPVYLFIVFLHPRTVIYWFNIHEVVSENNLLVERLLSNDTKYIELNIDYRNILTRESCGSFRKNVHQFLRLFEDSFQSFYCLKNRGPKIIPNTRLPRKFKELEDSLANYYSATPTENRVLLLETYFDTWEKLDNRFDYGYPLWHLRIALDTCHYRGVRTALKALFYMESPVLMEVGDDLNFVRDNMPVEERTRSLQDALVSIHNSKYISAEGWVFTPVVARKIANISVKMFEPEQVVPSLNKIRIHLQSWDYKHNKRFFVKGVNAIDAICSALDALRSFKHCDPVIAEMAKDLFERRVANSDQWSWEQKVHVVSYHSLYEYGCERTFSEMTPEAKHLIVDGIRKHPDPMVRLDCVKLYGKNKIAFINDIIIYINRRLEDCSNMEENIRLRKIRKYAKRFSMNSRKQTAH